MKTIFTLLLATLFTSAAFAYDDAKLSITVAARNVQVFVDGRAYSDNDNSFVLNNIQPGNHTIRIYRAGKNYGNSRRADRRSADLLYSSTVYVRPATHVDIMINRFGKALVDERALADRNGSWDDDRYDPYGNGTGNGYSQAMQDYEFNQLLSRIRNQWFSGEKMTTAKDAVSRNYFNTGQLRQLLQIFSTDAERLDLAKLSYRNCVDQQNFRQLYDLLSRQAQTDLDNTIRYNRY